jgi:hypothetical protein
VPGQAREGNDDRRPTQDVPVQGEPHEGNGNRRQRRPAAERPCTSAARACAGARQQPTRQWGRERRRNTPFPVGVLEPCRRGHAAARLLGAYNLRGAVSAPAVEGAA